MVDKISFHNESLKSWRYVMVDKAVTRHITNPPAQTVAEGQKCVYDFGGVDTNNNTVPEDRYLQVNYYAHYIDILYYSILFFLIITLSCL